MGHDRTDPGRRVLLAAAEVLRSWQASSRPSQRDHRASALWLRPNWPDALVLGPHRERLARQLADDRVLRQETRRRLVPAPGDFQAIWSDGTPDGEHAAAAWSAQHLGAALATSVDPQGLLEAASVADDPLVAAAAFPYLVREIPVPAGLDRPTPALPVEDPDVAGGRADVRISENRAEVKLLRRQLRAEQRRVGNLEKQLEALAAETAASRSTADDLRAQLPTSRQRRALANASQMDTSLRKLKRQLDKERTGRSDDRQAFESRLRAADAALAKAQEETEAERRGRRRLERELGDAAERAHRLEPLAAREADRLKAAAASMRDGREKTRALRRAERLEGLVAELRDLYPAADGLPPVTARSEGDAQVSIAGASAPTVGSARTSSRCLRVTPLGGANHIGGSALLIEAGDSRILVDAGLRPDAHVSNPGPERIAEAVEGRLDAVVITHAHADHAGYVPWLLERQRRTQVLCSRETAALLPAVWHDSVRVMRAEADATSRWASHVEPPYGDAEVAHAEDALRGVGYGQGVTVGQLELTLFKAGHILGAAGVVVRAGDRRVVVTGDIDDRGQASVGPAEIPRRLAFGSDLLVIETTYCDRHHEDRDREGQGLIRRAEEVLAVGGRILIPAFGLGRAQEIALLLGEHLPDVDVLVDGLARDISELYALNGAPEVLRGRVRKVSNRTREIVGFSNGAVITTSGMLTGGAAIPWAQAVLTEPHSALFLCGHQDEEAPGRELELLAEADPDRPREVLLRDEHGRPVTVSVAASVHRYNLSAHADSAGLTSIVDQIQPRAVMLVHGEAGSQAIFRERLRARGYTVVDNREAWDPTVGVPDQRLARRRHPAARSRVSRGRLQ